ncbi:MAG: hypothetical protein AAFN12_15405 [Cyanobacteria bacterium J06560_2]
MDLHLPVGIIDVLNSLPLLVDIALERFQPMSRQNSAQRNVTIGCDRN